MTTMPSRDSEDPHHPEGASASSIPDHLNQDVQFSPTNARRGIGSTYHSPHANTTTYATRPNSFASTFPNACSPSETNSALLTLEDFENRTAHSIGLAGEQDTDLLSLFRSVIINETNKVDAGVVQVFAGDAVGGEPPIHFNVLMDHFIPVDNITKSAASETIEELVGHDGPHLVKSYFERVHPANNILCRSRFLHAYAEDKSAVPPSLRGALYALAATISSDTSKQDNQSVSNVRMLLEQAHSSLHAEYHGPNLWNLQASLLLVHELPGENYTMETPRTWILSSKAVACAQLIGLHREPGQWNIAPWEKRLRRKLWWATYMCDIWTSISHGNPPHIYEASFTTKMPEVDELCSEEDDTDPMQDGVDRANTSQNITLAVRFLEAVKLSRIVHRLLNVAYTDQAYKAASMQPTERETTLLQIQRELKNWVLLRPSCLDEATQDSSQEFVYNAPLSLAYFAARVLLLRALMSPIIKDAKASPTSALQRYFDNAIHLCGEFNDFAKRIDSRALHGFWGAHARCQLVRLGNFLVYLFLMAPEPTKVQAAFDELERFHTCLHRLRALAKSDAAISLLRPTILRVDTLFKQAERIMSTGTKILGDISLSGALA